jgi:hypothetical protein
MPKPNPLTQGLERQAPATSAIRAVTNTQKPKNPASKAPVALSRTGRVLIGGHYAPEVQTALKIIAAEERTTVQALLAEGINTVFAKRHKPEIAQIPAE